MPDKINIADEIQSTVDEFADSMSPIQRGLYNRVSALLKSLSLDSDGNIKQTASNLSIINKVEIELNSVTKNPEFQDQVASINSALADVNQMQNHFFDVQIPDFAEPAVIPAFQEQAFNNAVTSLTGAGMQQEVVNHALDVVRDGIMEGASFADMNDLLRISMLGNKEIEGRLVAYTKQILSDTLHGQARDYNSIITKKLGLVWYEYIGPLRDTSRPWCIALEKKQWIHKSELAAICAGNIDGHKVSLAGLMPDTNKENVVSRCGGYNCMHHMVPVPAESVPDEIRAKFEDD